VLNIKIKSQDNRPHLQSERNSSWTWNTVNVLCKCYCLSVDFSTEAAHCTARSKT